jgi:phosphatidylserine decarboxylase
MKHSGRATKAALKLILISLIAVIVVWAVGFFGQVALTIIATFAGKVAPVLIVLWILFSLFTFYFFRDPNARTPTQAGLVVSPGHGKVDGIDTVKENEFMGGECQRVTIFLSVLNVHVQNAPVSGKIGFFKYTTGQFLSALKAESATHNENILIGFETTDPPSQKVGIRLIAGVLARRIVPFVQPGDEVGRGERISLIQFGSRVDVYLARNAKIKVKLGDKVVGGETVLAIFE